MLDARTTVNISCKPKKTNEPAKNPKKAYHNNSQISVQCNLCNHPKKFQSLQSLVYHIVRCHREKIDDDGNKRLTLEGKKLIKLLNQVSKAVDAKVFPENGRCTY